MRDDTSTSTARLSIGALAQATGIPAATLRTWERRYGFPKPVRLESGHRRYRLQDAKILERIRDLLAEGHRAADVLGVDAATLQRLCAFSQVGAASEATGLDAAPPAAAAEASPSDELAADVTVDALIAAIGTLDGVALAQLLHRAWAALGALGAIERVVGPMLVRIGELWRAGRLDVMHEHFASERLRDFLVEQWRPLASNAAVRVVSTTLPGERHVLGLHLCATALAHAGVGSVFLGAETPVTDVAHAVEATGAIAVVLSVAQGASSTRVNAQLVELREALAPHVTILIGGAGAPDLAGLSGVRRVHDLASLVDWGTSRRLERAPQAQR